MRFHFLLMSTLTILFFCPRSEIEIQLFALVSFGLQARKFYLYKTSPGYLLLTVFQYLLYSLGLASESS